MSRQGGGGLREKINSPLENYAQCAGRATKPSTAGWGRFQPRTHTHHTTHKARKNQRDTAHDNCAAPNTTTPEPGRRDFMMYYVYVPYFQVREVVN